MLLTDVEIRQTLGFAGLSNCCSMYAPGVLFKISSALESAPFMPFAASVKISSAPNAFRSTLLSKLIDAGIVNMSLYPLEAAMNARPMPVFPLVGSTKILYKGKEYKH